MPMLDAVLAFAITMLAVASVVTAIVGKLGASATYRRDTFRDQLNKFYDAHVKAVVNEKLKVGVEEADKRANEALSEFLSHMKAEGKVELSTQDLLDGLKETKLGRQLTAELGDQVGEFVDKLGTGWEQIGNEFSAKFRERARLASFVVGIALAIALNIDSIYIVETYLTNDEIRAEALGQQDAMLTQYATFLSAQAPGDDAVADAQADIESIKAEIEVLKGSGIPAGWDHAPWKRCGDDNGVFLPRCGAAAAGAVPGTEDGWFLWILGILLTGYLAGLGAPFWYDLVSGISHIAQAKRGSQQRNTGGRAETTRERVPS